MAYKPSEFKVDQELWVVPDDIRRLPYTDTIESIGRIYLVLKRTGKMNIENLRASNFGIYQAYLNKSDWDELKEKEKLSRKIHDATANRYSTPNYLNLDQLKRMSAIIDEPKSS